MTTVEIQNYFETVKNLILEYSTNFVVAMLILLIGLWVTSFITKAAKKVMLARNIEVTLSTFIGNLIFWTLRILLFVTVISKLGIETSSFVAILGAPGLAIGLSLQGSLSNFAGGMLIILFKPFRVGDTIEAQGVIGTVLEIQIFVTKLITGNNQTIFVPNGILSNGVIINYSMQGNRRADLVFSLSYDTNIKIAKDIVMKVMLDHPKVLKNPEPTVSVRDLTDSAIHLSIKPWATNIDFGDMASDILENCKEAFDAAGIVTQPFVREYSKE